MPTIGIDDVTNTKIWGCPHSRFHPIRLDDGRTW
jgi:hypothetical protein